MLNEMPEIRTPAWVTRPFHRAGYHFPTHHHNFAEIFWVERGTITHLVGTHEETLQAGDIRFIHPDTRHSTNVEKSATLVNIGLPIPFVDKLTAFVGSLPFQAGAAPGMHIDPLHWAQLNEWRDKLLAPELSELTLGAFLLWLFSEYEQIRDQKAGIVPWINAMLQRLDDPWVLSKGVSALVASTGRSHSSLNRAVRSRFNCTVIQLINQHRIIWLSRQLRQGSTPIHDLARSCGLANLSHCYRVFHQVHGCTPGEYRRRAHHEDLADGDRMAIHLVEVKASPATDESTAPASGPHTPP